MHESHPHLQAQPLSLRLFFFSTLDEEELEAELLLEFLDELLLDEELLLGEDCELLLLAELLEDALLDEGIARLSFRPEPGCKEDYPAKPPPLRSCPS